MAKTLTTIKIEKYQKDDILSKLKVILINYKKITNLLTNMNIKGGRIYFSYDPLKNDVDKYFARISLYDYELENCSVEFPKSGEKWKNTFHGNIEKCIEHIAENLEI